jgi:hypothetical protein
VRREQAPHVIAHVGIIFDEKNERTLGRAAPLCWFARTDLPVPRSRFVVTACGRLCLHRKRINIATLFGQRFD